MNGQRALRSAAHKVCRHQLGRALPSASYRRLFVSEKQFHSSPSVAAQSLRGGLGGIFDSLELPPGLFDDVPGVVTKKQKAPIDDGRAVPTEDLLPSHAVLRKLYDENRIQLAPKELVEFVDVVRKIVTSQPLDKIKLENTVMKLASGNVGDVTSIGVMLVRHSKAGAPLGIRLLEVATKKGDMDAEHQYAQLLCQDIAGAEKNVKKALNHMRRLAEKNHARSQYIMGLRYIFTASDMKGGLAFLESAAAAGIAEAACQLGIIYWQGLEGWVPQNIERGLKYLNQAHEAGLTEATFALGEYYRKLDTTSDIKTAFELYTAAANKGHSSAQHNLGVMYLDGDRAAGIPRDVHRAIEYWKMAAAQGTDHSKLNLAQIYATGIRIPGKLFARIEPNPDLAKQYLTDVIKAGGPLAAVAEEILKRVMIESVGDQHARDEASKEKANGTGCTVM